ncbi:MAG: response regulator transcription factor [Pseudomonadota bacterium]
MLTPERIRILVADERSIFRRGLCAVLMAKEHFHIVGLADHDDEIQRKTAQLHPDVVVIDLEAGRRLSLLPDLIRQCPDSRILALGDGAEVDTVEEALRAGAAGYVLRSAEDDELPQAVEAIHRGETYLAPETRRLLQGYAARRTPPERAGRRLTAREREILRLIAEGLPNKDVASALTISVRTVENHRASIMKKLDLRSVVDLVKYAIASGIVQVRRD